MSLTDASAQEGDSASTIIEFTVRLSHPATTPLHIPFHTVDGTARAADDDYQPASGTVELLPDELTATVPVTVYGDRVLEANERFTVALDWIPGIVLVRGAALGTICNDERTSFTELAVNVADYIVGSFPPVWGDANGDGWPDLPMYLNLGGVFTEMPGFRDLLAEGNYHGGGWCDYDRDGDEDLAILPYITGSDTYSRLFRSESWGFTDVAAQLGMDLAAHGETPVWADFDGDGWPDLFTPFYSHEFPFRSFFYLNLHNGHFDEDAEAAGIALPNLQVWERPEGAAGVDIDDDGDIDLYCASHLFLNDGTAHFTDVRPQVGLPITFDEGVNFVDVDNDGDFDLYVRGYERPVLYRNDAGYFTDLSAGLGLGAIDQLWGDSWADVENDGDLDLLVYIWGEPARLLLNRGDGTFVEDPSFRSLNIQEVLSSWADLDRDGDMDFVAGDFVKRFFRNRLERVAGSEHSSLRVRVVDEDGHPSVPGATIRLRSLDDPGAPIQTRAVDGGSGYLAQNEYTVTFGGVQTGRFSIDVSYPSAPGTRKIVNAATNSMLGSIEPSTTELTCFTVYRDGRVERAALPPHGLEVGTDPAIPATALAVPSPNPASVSSTIGFRLEHRQSVSIAVHDVSGRRVRMLADGDWPAGAHRMSWDLKDTNGHAVPIGVYFVRMRLAGVVVGEQRLTVLH